MNRSLTIAGLTCLTLIIVLSTVNNVFAVAAEDQEPEAYVSGITLGRAKSLIGVALGISSLVIGWRTKARSRNNGKVSTSWTVVGVMIGLAAVVLSIFHLTANTGGFGTGGGKAGAIVALLVGLCGTVLCVVASRSKKISSEG